MARAAKSTIDHDTIREWVESKGGHPAAVKGTGKRGDPGIIRIDFPGFSGEQSLEAISWDQFFRAFEASELAFLYRDEDRFNKLVGRDTLESKARGEQRGGRRAAERELEPEERARRSRARVAQKRQRIEAATTRSPRPAKKAAKSGRARVTAHKKAGGATRRATSAVKTNAARRTAGSRTRAPTKSAGSRTRSTSGAKRGAAAPSRRRSTRTAAAR